METKKWSVPANLSEIAVQVEQDGPNLDEDMEKVFAPAETLSIQFHDETEANGHHHYDEKDYKSHRSESFPHTHHPLKSIHSRSMRSLVGLKGKHEFPPSALRKASLPHHIHLQAVESLRASDEGFIKSKASTFSLPEDLIRSQYHVNRMTSEGTSSPTSPIHTNSELPTIVVQDFDEEYSSHERRDSTRNITDVLQSITDVDEDLHTDESQSFKTLFQTSTPLLGYQEPLLATKYSEETLSSQPLVSERASHMGRQFSFDDGTKPRVTFQLGDDSALDQEKEEQITTDADDHHLSPKHEEKSDTKHKHHKHKHHHHHKHSRGEDPLWRTRSGIETGSSALRRIPTELEEAATLQKADLDDMASHRFEDVRGIRRHKIHAKSSVSSFIHFGKKSLEDASKGLPHMKKKFDHSPHEVFVELDELVVEAGEEPTWKETARWIKYEEDVEEGADRWGKPHVASLSFHSLLELRKCLEHGTVLLDLEETDLPGIAHRVVDNMVITDQIKPEDSGALLRALLLRHRHVADRKQLMRRNVSVMNLFDMERTKSDKSMNKELSATSLDSRKGAEMEPLKVDFDNNQKESDTISYQSLSDRPDPSIMKKIPKGAEASTVLVGAVNFLHQPTIAFVRLAKGTIMANLLEVPIPVRFLFILLGPIQSSLDYREIGRSISTLMSNRSFHEIAYKADDRKDLLSAINEFLDYSIVLPPGEWERKALLPIIDIKKQNMQLRRRRRRHHKSGESDTLLKEEKEKIEDPLKRTGHLFGGLKNDIKRRYAVYLSDFTDALNFECFTTFIFLYFACLAPAITFGGLLGEKTTNWMGVSELLLSTAACGIVFALLAGQPLTILGATGPVLVFEESVYKFCKSHNVEFLPLRVWIGMWIAIIATLVIALEGSFLVRFFTRFTEEIFACLISLIFIYECFKKLYDIFKKHPLMSDYCSIDVNNNSSYISKENLSFHHFLNNESLANMSDTLMMARSDDEVLNKPNTALLSTILLFGTFFIAFFLKKFRNSKFLGRTARRALADFGVPIAILVIVFLDYLITDIYTTKLKVPSGISPTDPEKRGWFINPLGMKEPIATWQVFAAIIPAFLVFILLFIEMQITGLILNKKERKLKKGTGYHLDLLLIGWMTLGCSLLGLPWMCAATVRTLSHISGLTVMSKTHAPGEKPQIVHVYEQRVTNIAVSLMLGVSIFVGPILRQVPIAVLFGVFLYMGINSLDGIQMVDRITLLFKPVKHHPDVGYVRRVRTWKMHLYTIIQILCLSVLWACKSTEAALAFPFLLVLMIPVRKQLRWIFTESELVELDNEELESDEYESEDDVCEKVPLPV